MRLQEQDIFAEEAERGGTDVAAASAISWQYPTARVG